MSNPLLMEIADLQEINAGIVARQRDAITMLERIEADQLDRDEEAEARDTRLVIDILRGRAKLPPDHGYMTCTECGKVGTVDDLCVVGEDCPDEDCDGTIIHWEYE